MDANQRKEIEERVAAATEGPWEAVPECPDSIAANVMRTTVPGGQKLSATWIAVVDMENRHDYTDELESESAEIDRQFIAHARTDIPALLSALDAAEARAVAAEDRVRELEPYAKFGRMFVEKVGMDDSWWGDEWSEDVMPLAVQAGIAERVPYDPEIHGEGVESEPGDEIWVWLPLKAQGSGE